MYNVGDIFYLDEEYYSRAEFCNNNNFVIVEIEPDENGRRFQIEKVPEPTEEERLDSLRARREQECFSIVNRGVLWYNTLSEEQSVELNNWYLAWLDVTETGIIPQKPEWLK